MSDRRILRVKAGHFEAYYTAEEGWRCENAYWQSELERLTKRWGGPSVHTSNPERELARYLVFCYPELIRVIDLPPDKPWPAPQSPDLIY